MTNIIENLDLHRVDKDIKEALNEDVGTGDVTAALVDNHKTVKAKLITREDAILAGQSWFERTFSALDETTRVEWFHADGDRIHAGDTVAYIAGNYRAILTAERTALNYLQMLSAIATNTARYVAAMPAHTKLLDTRKTLPKLRYSQRYAVRVGGGVNHRFGLFDAYLIKENHLRESESITAIIARARQLQPSLKLEVEVESVEQFIEAKEAGADVVMLDNFSDIQIKKAIEHNQDKSVLIEVSGNVTLDTISRLAIPGVDYISSGSLTKSFQAIDLSLQLL